MEALTTQIGDVLTLCSTALDFLLQNAVLAFPVVCGIVGVIFGVIRKARHV